MQSYNKVVIRGKLSQNVTRLVMAKEQRCWIKVCDRQQQRLGITGRRRVATKRKKRSLEEAPNSVMRKHPRNLIHVPE
jgi:hypothetical protein